MGTKRENNRTEHAAGQSGRSDLKEFVEARDGAAHPERDPKRATGTHRHEDQQNQFIDNHNLRK